MAEKNANIWIETEREPSIEITEESGDVNVVMAGTMMFSPDEDMDPIIKDYLEHPNELTIIYMGASPLTASSYTHTQGIGSDTWYINHGMNRVGVIIQCFDNSNREVKAEVEHIDNNNAIIRFGLVMSGTAECR